MGMCIVPVCLIEICLLLTDLGVSNRPLPCVTPEGLPHWPVQGWPVLHGVY